MVSSASENRDKTADSTAGERLSPLFSSVFLLTLAEDETLQAVDRKFLREASACIDALCRRVHDLEQA